MTAAFDASPSAEPERTRAAPRILIVDDNREMVSSLCDIVELRGWASDRAGSGEAAVAMFNRERYDAVLMDIRMPGINGVEALRMMKRHRPQVPVILMTAYTEHRLVDKANAEGVTEVLAKPLAIETLFGLLERIEKR